MKQLVKTCTKCGWNYPAAVPRHTCRYCKEVFTEGVCNVCGAYYWNYKSYNGKCKICNSEYRKGAYSKYKDAYDRAHATYINTKKQEADIKYTKWLEQLVEANELCGYLSEDEWLKAVNHFGGCAYCGKEDIDARGFFIAFKNGGRYNRLNVIPICDSCATWNYSYAATNPFKSLNYAINSSSLKHKGIHNSGEAIVDYLQSRINEVLNNGKTV